VRLAAYLKCRNRSPKKKEWRSNMTDHSTTPIPQEPIPEDPDSSSQREESAASAQERAKASELKGPSGSQKAAYTLFSRETRTGRFFRGLLRILALIVGLTALGALAVYILLYRPVDQQLRETRLQATQTAGQLEQAQQDLVRAQQSVNDSQTQEQDAQSRLDLELTRIGVLRMANTVTMARLALAKNDKAAAAAALGDAQAQLKKIQPQLEKLDPTQVSTLQALFTLSKTDLDRDFKLANQDLDRLMSELERLDQNLK